MTYEQLDAWTRRIFAWQRDEHAAFVARITPICNACELRNGPQGCIGKKCPVNFALDAINKIGKRVKTAHKAIVIENFSKEN